MPDVSDPATRSPGDDAPPAASGEVKPPRAKRPLFVRILIGLLIGVAIGQIFGRDPILFGWNYEDNKTLAGLYVQFLTTLATPLIFFAIVEAFVQTPLTGRQGLKMFLICAANIAVAFVIGLTILNVFQPGKQWSRDFAERADAVARSGPSEGRPVAGPKGKDIAEKASKTSLSPLALLKSYVPTNIAQPFAENMVLTVAVLAILVGAAMRSLQHAGDAETVAAIAAFARLIVASYQIVLRILLGLIELAPYAICLAVAAAVGESGLAVFRTLGVYVATVISALALHSLVYYPLSAWWIGGKSPRVYFGEGLQAILTGLSINSSLATVPKTLDALRRMGVSESSARLSACVGTNFNNDGITLYEAITALFIAQAIGMGMNLMEQVVILAATLAGSMGIAGIPNSGLIILALVLKAAKLPDEAIQMAIPLVYSVDVIHGRLLGGQRHGRPAGRDPARPDRERREAGADRGILIQGESAPGREFC